jgi:hypothetical protein
MLFLENLIRALLIFNGLRSCHCQRALLVYHYPIEDDDMNPTRMTLREFYLTLIDDLIREVQQTGPAPQNNWSAESGPPLVNYLAGLRDRVVQVRGPTDLSEADDLMLRLITFYNLTNTEVRLELESLRKTLRDRGLI